MKSRILLAVLFIALIAIPASASVQNIKVSGDVDSTWLVRDNFDLGFTGNGTVAADTDPWNVRQGDRNQNLFITQTRLRVDADLTDNVSAVVGLINEKPWDSVEQQTNGDENDIDINLAYVTLREMLYAPLTVVIGRQAFAYGNSFIIDSAGINSNVAAGGLNNVAEDLSKRTAQDAIRLILDYDPLTVDLLYAKIDSNTLTGLADDKDDVDLFGVNANYQLGDDMDTEVEAYFWTRIDRNITAAATGDPEKSDTIYVPGFRASSNVLDGLNVQAELAWQKGNKSTTNGALTIRPDNQQRDAFGAQAIAVYSLPFEETKEYEPVLTTTYTFVSGDSNPYDATDRGNNNGDTAEKYQSWDPMYENQAGGKIYNSLFALTNSHIYTVTGSFKPIEDVTAAFCWTGLWAHHKVNADDAVKGAFGTEVFTLLQPDGTALNPNVTTDKAVGNELDAYLTYDYTEDVQIGATLGWFIPGDFFASTNDSVASQAMINVDVAF